MSAFSQTFGVDKSFEQLKHADKETKEKVTFIENSNFKLPLESGTVDLITVGILYVIDSIRVN